MNELLLKLQSRFPLSELTPLTGGGTNSVYQLRQNGRQSVLKIARISNKNAETETICLNLLNETGLAPRLLQDFQIENMKILQMEYVEGKTILELILDLREDSKFDQIYSLFSAMGRLLAKLHASSKQVEIGNISLTIPQNKSFIEHELYLRSIDLITNLNEHSKELLHGDFGYHNIIINPSRKMRIIDWELAGIGDPRIDVSNVLFWTHLHFPEIAQRCVNEFLSAYTNDVNLDCSTGVIKSFVIIQLWRIINLANDNFPINVKKEWNRRLSWTLDHDFV